jgi:capsular exopolysaccharide synthesis family protein
MAEQMRTKVEVTERTAKWLDERLQELKERVEGTERTAEKFRNNAGLIRGDAGPLIFQDMSKLNAELAEARAARTEIMARVQEAERAVTGGSRGITAEVLRSPLIQDLSKQFVNLKQQETNLLKVIGEKHPNIQALRAQIADMETAIGTETRALLTGMRSEASAARAREQMLTEQVKLLKGQTAEMAQAEVQLRSLEADSEGSRAMLNHLQTRLNEVLLQRDVLQPDARILSAATVPTKPSAPNKPLILLLAAMFSGILGVVIAMAREALDSKVRSADQLTPAATLPMLGMVPRLPLGARRQHVASRYMLEHPRSAFSESINAIITTLLLRAGGSGPNVVMVSSSLPSEGKSLFSLSLARAGALLGQRVLLIDADLRRPSLHRLIDFEPGPGLSDLLRSNASLDEVIRTDPLSNLQLIPCGTPIGNPLPLISSGNFVALLSAAKRSFDIVIIDGPPLLLVPDGRILAARADQTIFLARWGKTPVTQALHALRILGVSGARIGGVVVSQVNVRKHAEYNFSDSGHYHMAKAYYHQ